MFVRIGRFFKAIFNAILGEAEGQIPISMLEESVREMLDNLRALREATATTIAFETRAKRERDGISVDDNTWKEILAAAAKVKLDPSRIEKLARG